MSVPAQEETGGFSLIITVTIQPDKYDEWLRHSWEAFKHVTAEPDCLSFEMFSIPGEPNKVKWVETWSKSLEAVMAVSSFLRPLPVSPGRQYDAKHLPNSGRQGGFLGLIEDQGNKEYMKTYKEVTDPLLIGEPTWELMKRFGGEWARAQEGVYQKP